jgi:hypothetical protein
LSAGGAFFTNGTHISTQVLHGFAGVSQPARPVIEWEYTNNVAGASIEFSFNAAPASAGTLGVNRFTSSDALTTNQSIQMVVEERVP